VGVVQTSHRGHLASEKITIEFLHFFSETTDDVRGFLLNYFGALQDLLGDVPSVDPEKDSH
jgi:hypothetical protein